MLTPMSDEVREQFEFLKTLMNSPSRYRDRIGLVVDWIERNLAATEAVETVNHPSHYNQGGIECVDAIHAMLTAEEYRGFIKGTVVCYVWREKFKNGNEDLRKSIWWLEDVLKRAANQSA